MTPQAPDNLSSEVAALFPNNRWSGAVYDQGNPGVGNLTGTGGYSFAYDAENRLVWSALTNASTVYGYVYDGDGRRVQKVTCPAAGTAPCTPASAGAAVTATYVYDAMGDLAAEYGTPAAASPCTTCYLTADHLGSTRMLTHGTTGAPVALHDYLPFGEEVPAGMNGRGALYDLADPKQRFTGKERDQETGLDFFKARYFGSPPGRFTSPDPLGISKQKLVDPQQWNMYAYGRNNPLRFTDPTGKYGCADGKDCDSKKDKEFEKARQRDLKSKDPAVVAAAKAYGDPTKANGVSVGFAKSLPAGCAGGAGCTQPGITGTATGITPDVKVTFLNSAVDGGGKAFDQLVGHEGSHTADALSFLNPYDAATGKFKGFLNYVHYDTEFKAYAIGASVRNGEAYSRGTCGGSPCVFGANDSMQDRYWKIDDMLTDPQSHYRNDLEKFQFDPSIYPQ